MKFAVPSVRALSTNVEAFTSSVPTPSDELRRTRII